MRFLYFVDDEREAESARSKLIDSGIEHIAVTVKGWDDLVSTVQEDRLDLVLCGYPLEGVDELAALAVVREQDEHLPFIFMCDPAAEREALEALEASETDYVLGNQRARLAPLVRRAIRERESAVRLQRTEAALEESDRKYNLLFEQVSDGVIVFDAATGRIVDVNPAGVELYGYSLEEFRKLRLTDLSEEPIEAVATFRDLVDGAVDSPPLRLHRRRDGALFSARISASTSSNAGHPVVVGFLKQPPAQPQAEEGRYRLLFERNVAGVYRSTLEGEMLDCNESFARIFGYETRTQAVAGGTAVLYDSPEVRQKLTDELVRAGSVSAWEQPMRRRDGARVWALVSASLIEGVSGQNTTIEGSVIDLTERRRLEGRLAQVQKLEAVGQLAGGIAHDFNNLLQAISASADALSSSHPEASASGQELMTIQQTVDRGAELTRRLLAIGRGQVLEMKAVDLSQLITEELEILRRVIPEDVDIVFTPSEDLPMIVADRGQLAQVLLNLVLNARDAMPNGGSIGLDASKVVLDAEDTLARPGVCKGPYIRLTVTDSGTGMGASVLARIFEPFFTTKLEGRGSGMGLATVYGIVTQHGGFVEVRSEPGKGSAFDVFLKVASSKPSPQPAVRPESVSGGDETVLLVEDDQAVRRAVGRILAELGYAVIEASNGAEALHELEKESCPVDLVISDVVMPKMGGLELLARARQTLPEIPFLFSTGYADGTLRDQLCRQTSVSFIAKPFRMEEIAGRLRDALRGRA